MSLATFIIGLSLGLLANRKKQPTIAEMEFRILADELVKHAQASTEGNHVND